MKNVTELEMALLNQVKNYTVTQFSSSNFMWIYTEDLKGDMRVNRALISTLIQKGILEMDSYEEINDALKVKSDFYQVNENEIANFINISIK